MITTTLGHLVAAEPALTRLATVRLPVKIAYQIVKLAKLVAAETASYQTVRVDIIKELGSEREATPEERKRSGATVIEVLDEHRVTFATRMTELAAAAVTLAAEPLVVADFGAIDITAADLAALEPLLIDRLPPSPDKDPRK